MNESEFNDRIDATLLAIEEAIDESGADLDYETTNGILTLTCPNDTVIIINRQAAALQLWVAAKSGGFHFDFVEAQSQWLRDDDQEPLSDLLARAVKAQSEEEVDFSPLASLGL